MRIDEEKADWTVLEIEGVESAIKSTVARFIWDWEWLEPRREDVEQEARLLVAVRLDLRDAAARLATDQGLLAYRLRADLEDAHKGRQRTINDTERPLEPWSEWEREWVPITEPITDAFYALDTSDTYTEREIGALLPLTFDPTYTYPNCHPTDPGSTPRHTHHPAQVADVSRAWRGTEDVKEFETRLVTRSV